MERKYILATVAQCSGNRTRAAKILKISIRGLRMKLHNYAAESDPELPPKVGDEFGEFLKSDLCDLWHLSCGGAALA